MDIKTKRISKLPQIEAIGEKTNIIVEENGEAKKIPAVNMGNGLPEGEKPYQQLVTDESGKVVWENKINCIPEPSTAAVGQIVAVKAVDENGKPTEWEVKDAGNSLPEPSANKWLVTDSEGNAVWEDKPFGEVRQYNVVCAPYDNQSVVSGHSSLEMHTVNGVDYGYEFPIDGNMVVIYDGTEYECSIYFNKNSPTSGYWMIGNQSLSENYAGENNEMPFCFYFSGNVPSGSSTGNVSSKYVYFNDNVEHTISLNIVDEVVKTLEQKYMPEFILQSSTEGSTKKFKLTVDDSGTITATEVT